MSKEPLERCDVCGSLLIAVPWLDEHGIRIEREAFKRRHQFCRRNRNNRPQEGTES